MLECLNFIQKSIERCLSVEDQPKQSSVLNLLTKFATQNNISERVLVHCYRMNFFFLMRVESMVAKEAMLSANEMCSKFGTTPKNLLNWHREELFKCLVLGCVGNFLQYGFGINKTLINVSKKKIQNYLEKRYLYTKSRFLD